MDINSSFCQISFYENESGVGDEFWLIIICNCKALFHARCLRLMHDIILLWKGRHCFAIGLESLAPAVTYPSYIL